MLLRLTCQPVSSSGAGGAVGVKSFGKMRGMTYLMDLLFYDKGRIDKKSNTMHSALCALTRPPPHLLLLIDFTMCTEPTLLLVSGMISVKSVGLMIVGNHLLSLQPWSENFSSPMPVCLYFADNAVQRNVHH